MPKEVPMLFSTPMVISIHDDIKTNTRRVIKLPSWSTGDWNDFETDGNKAFVICKNTGCLAEIKPPCQKGDTIWVRETWQHSECFDYRVKNQYFYKADPYIKGYVDEHHISWRPSIHMPRAAARTFLMVTDVKVERLQDITKEDAEKEGMSAKGSRIAHDEYPNSDYDFILEEFETLWDSIYGNWNENPWVWVIKFERTEKP